MYLFSQEDQFWMQQALALAYYAASVDEVPVGAVVVQQGKLLGEGANATISLQDPTAHAEIIALRMAAQVCNNYRLPHTTLYVTLEPCLMCLGALFHARVARIVYGTTDSKTGVCHSVLPLSEHKQLNHHAMIQGGLFSQQSQGLLRSFFRKKRL